MESVARWTVIVPVRGGSESKSRLAAAVAPALRAELAAAFTCDTLLALAEAEAVDRIMVVTPDVLGASRAGRRVRAATIGGRSPRLEIVAQEASATGLNEAIRQAARGLVGPVAVLLADLPALTAADIDTVLSDPLAADRFAVPDRTSTGTTLLADRVGCLDPHFGADSAARHRVAGYALIVTAPPRLRCDVDTVADLRAAQRLGVGTFTAPLLGRVSA